MSHTFKGSIQNAINPESGVNIVVKNLEEEKIILAPSGFSYDFDKKHDKDTLSFTLIPSSGTVEGREVKVDLKNGTEKVTASPPGWEVAIKSTSKTEPTELSLAVLRKME